MRGHRGGATPLHPGVPGRRLHEGKQSPCRPWDNASCTILWESAASSNCASALVGSVDHRARTHHGSHLRRHPRFNPELRCARALSTHARLEANGIIAGAMFHEPGLALGRLARAGQRCGPRATLTPRRWSRSSNPTRCVPHLRHHLLDSISRSASQLDQHSHPPIRLPHGPWRAPLSPA